MENNMILLLMGILFGYLLRPLFKTGDKMCDDCIGKNKVKNG